MVRWRWRWRWLFDVEDSWVTICSSLPLSYYMIIWYLYRCDGWIDGWMDRWKKGCVLFFETNGFFFFFGSHPVLFNLATCFSIGPTELDDYLITVTMLSSTNFRLFLLHSVTFGEKILALRVLQRGLSIHSFSSGLLTSFNSLLLTDLKYFFSTIFVVLFAASVEFL